MGEMDKDKVSPKQLKAIGKILTKRMLNALANASKYNITMDEALNISPFVQYAMCVNDDNRPAKHVGDWPKFGVYYPIRIVESKTEAIFIVQVLGFTGEAPFFNGFSQERFALTPSSIPIGMN